MAGGAGLGHGRMIEACTTPRDGVMAQVTFGCSLYMARMLAGRGNAVMARTTAAYNSGMIDSADTVECDRIVAVFTLSG